jgi:hypothetical protein
MQQHNDKLGTGQPLQATLVFCSSVHRSEERIGTGQHMQNVSISGLHHKKFCILLGRGLHETGGIKQYQTHLKPGKAKVLGKKTQKARKDKHKVQGAYCFKCQCL